MWQKKKRNKILLLGLIVLVSVVFIFLGYHKCLLNGYVPEDNLKIVFLDIGQGDAILVQDDQGKNILIDGGPSREIIYKLDSYLPFYNRKIDLMILTHFDSDHVIGLTEVLKRMPVKKIIFPGDKGETPASQEWLRIKEKKDISTVIAFAPMKIDLENNLLIDFYWPEKDFIKEKEGSNNLVSLVFKLKFKEKTILFAGDAPKEIEERILLKNYDLKSDLLKVGHHGSKHSSSKEFLKEVDPLCGIISVGENNFGHPSLRVLKNLTEQEIEILRTDQLGDIVFLTNGKQMFFLDK